MLNDGYRLNDHVDEGRPVPLGITGPSKVLDEEKPGGKSNQQKPDRRFMKSSSVVFV